MPSHQFCMNFPYKILVVGSPGSGKTTLTRQLAQLGHMTAVHLDDLYWQENWKEPNSACWKKQITQLITGEHWLIDGNHAPTLPERINRANIVILLDTPIIICIYRIISRAIRIMAGQAEHLPARMQKQVLVGGKVSSISGVKDFCNLLKTVIFFYKQRRVIMRLITESSCPPALITVPWHINCPVDIEQLLTKIYFFRECSNTVRPDKLHVDGER